MMFPIAPPIAPTGSVPSFERLSKSVIRMKIEPTMNAVTIARNGTSDRAQEPAQAPHSRASHEHPDLLVGRIGAVEDPDDPSARA